MATTASLKKVSRSIAVLAASAVVERYPCWAGGAAAGISPLTRVSVATAHASSAPPVSGADAARGTVPASVERNRCPHTDFAPLGAAGWLHAVMGACPQPDVAGAPTRPGARPAGRDC